MTWGIIAALDAELALILEAMKVQQTKTIYGVEFHIGEIGSSKVVAVCSSVGTINATACASVLTRELGATVLVNIGVAGCACEELEVLDVVLGDEMLFHDADTPIIKKYYPHRESFLADPKLIALAEQSISNMKAEFSYKIGRIATGDIFVNDPDLKKDIIRRVAPLCVEMEGAAIAQVAFMSDLPFLVIRSMSDKSDGSASVSFAEFMPKAAKNSAGIVLGMIALAEKNGSL